MGEYARFFHDTTDVNCKLLVVERIHPQSKKFAMGMENKSTGDSRLNDSPECYIT